MKATKILRNDQELIDRFLAAFGLGAVSAAQNKPVQPGFFIYGCSFIKEFIEGNYFKKEQVLLKVLEENGLAADSGPLQHTREEIANCKEMSDELMAAARQWQAGDVDGRNSIIWATSSYTSILRQHIDRSRSIIFPLAEQLIPPEEQYKIAEAYNHIVFEEGENHPVEHYEKIVAALKDETDDWK
jgi:hemerythrin-like domain-containing protein